MIGYLSGKLLALEDHGALVDVGGVGYSVIVPSQTLVGLSPGKPIELYIHTNLRENALELFGFSNAWEKRVFLTLTSVSGVGPRTAVTMLSGLDAETILSAIVREDRATLTSLSGVGKKTVERLFIELADKARKLLSERPQKGVARIQGVPNEVEAPRVSEGAAVSNTSRKAKSKQTKDIPPQGASASPEQSGIDIADLWNEALAALANLGYRETDAIAAIRVASSEISDKGLPVSLEALIRSSLQLMSRGLMK